MLLYLGVGAKILKKIKQRNKKSQNFSKKLGRQRVAKNDKMSGK